jgi:hypothetical protein
MADENLVGSRSPPARQTGLHFVSKTPVRSQERFQVSSGSSPATVRSSVGVAPFARGGPVCLADRYRTPGAPAPVKDALVVFGYPDIWRNFGKLPATRNSCRMRARCLRLAALLHRRATARANDSRGRGT